MLIDNKTTRKFFSDYQTIAEFLRGYSERGSLDVVTGYFTVGALSLLFQDLDGVSNFRFILGQLLKDSNLKEKIVDLISGQYDIKTGFQISNQALYVVNKLKSENVQVRTIKKVFCHAKTYIYSDPDPRKNYYIVGSSNLTEAGLGYKIGSNIELNVADTGNSNDFKELTEWFNEIWNNFAEEFIVIEGKKITVKEYIIELISNLFKEYTPFQLYYKILYELFKDEFEALSTSEELTREYIHLNETVIYKTLYPFQRYGVLSLIRILKKYNGAILADAVGLGKTWTALAVMKYYQNLGYNVLVLCPKKLRYNWEQYKVGNSSCFEKDEIDFSIRYHTDLQGERFNSYGDKTLKYFQTRKKLLIVIDESHNLRNDKSLRYKFLVENLLMPNSDSRDVKVLLLSATPINNTLIDVRNQFKLTVKGKDDGFKETDLEIKSLESVFRTAQAHFNEWSNNEKRTIAEFIKKLDRQFERLTDALIVARTRKLIKLDKFKLNFPEKEKPDNIFITPEKIGNFNSLKDILDALDKIDFVAYQPTKYIEKPKVKSVLEDQAQREKFLAKMIYILLIKRLESSWNAFKITLENILKQHQNALQKINHYRKEFKDETLETDSLIDDEEANEVEFYFEDLNLETIGKKNPVKISEIKNIEGYKADLEKDIQYMNKVLENFTQFENDLNSSNAKDPKFEKLVEIIKEKQNKPNKKVLIFTAFKDTAVYLYKNLIKYGFKRIAYVSGSESKTDDGYSGQKYEEILERFAPFTKLFKEKDWSDLYNRLNLNSPSLLQDNISLEYQEWQEIIRSYDKKTAKKLENPIDILIATDCLSEGQNLQDCDLVINYDIHWNPVRLIQRIGRIDRIGSPNKIIKAVNFWPAKSYEDYLQLKSRVENRLALMTLVGTEVDSGISAKVEEMIKDNPLISKQEEKMLEQLQLTFENVEDSEETLGFDDLSLEQFRQELYEFLKKDEMFFKKIPNGVFTGFKIYPYEPYKNIPESIIVALGYPKREAGDIESKYQEIYLVHIPINVENPDNSPNSQVQILSNSHEILNFLRNNKFKDRYVPENIERGDPHTLNKFSELIHKWINDQVKPAAHDLIKSLFNNPNMKNIKKSDKKLEEKFKPENFDLINWFVISKF